MSYKVKCIICNKVLKRVQCQKSKCSFHKHNCNRDISTCLLCLPELFPFGKIDDKDVKSLFANPKLQQIKNGLTYKDLNYLNLNGIDDECSLNEALDPDINFYNDIQCKKSLYYSHNDLNKFSESIHTKNLSLLHINCRSLKKNFDNLCILLNDIDLKFDIIAVSETWLKTNDDINTFSLNGFKTEFVHRESKKGGGVIIYTNEKFKTTKLDVLSFSQRNFMEAIALEIEFNNQKINVACIYKPPKVNVKTFTDKFKDYVESLSTKNETYICGDFNINLLKHESHTDTKIFADQMFSSGFYPLINKPTRITENTATLIDNIWCNNVNHTHDSFSGIIIDDLSDHLPIFHTCSGKYALKQNTETNVKYIRQENDNNLLKMCNKLSNLTWSNVLQESDVNKAYDSFLEIYKKTYDECCPLKQAKKSKKISKEWMTNGLKNACRKKNVLYRHFLKSRDKSSEKRYKIYKNKLTSILRSTERDFYRNQLYAYRDDIKKTWNVLNTVLNKKCKKNPEVSTFIKEGKPITDNLEISNSFNDFFVNIGPSLASKIDHNNSTDFRHFMTDRNMSSFFLSPISEKDILDVVKKFKNKNSNDSENIKMSAVKKMINVIVKPLTHICNTSLKNGIFPEKMKMAKVIPVFKSGAPDEFGNYRPISLLPQFSKILEKVFYKKLLSFLDKNKILSNSQYGFREKHSTAHAISELVETISDAIDQGNYCVGIFIDLKKAFDTIDHTILLNKLEFYGIRGQALQWLNSYLSQRHQFVSYNNSNSKKKLITCESLKDLY